MSIISSDKVKLYSWWDLREGRRQTEKEIECLLAAGSHLIGLITV